MALMDFLSNLLGNNQGGNQQSSGGLQSLLASIGIGQSTQTEPKPKTTNDWGGLGKNLDTMSSGGKPDFTAILQALTPKEYQRTPLLDRSKDDIMSTIGAIGKNLSAASSNNPQRFGVGALIGQALGATDDQQKTDYASRQKQIQDVIKEATGMAEKSGALQNEAGKLAQEKIKNANTNNYQMGGLGELIRNNTMDNSYKQGMLGVHQGMLGVQQQNASNEQYSPLGMDADGNAMLFDKKSGKVINAGQVNMNKGGGAKGAKLPAIGFKEADQAWDQLQNAFSGNLDPSTKTQLLNEFAAEAQTNGNNTPAALQAVLDKYGVKNGKPTRGFKDNGFMMGNNYVLDSGGGAGNPAAAGGKNIESILQKAKQQGATPAQIDEIRKRMGG